MSKAKQLGDSRSFAAAGAGRSARRRAIEEATGEAEPVTARARLDELAPNPSNVRRDVGDVQELADSFRAAGQLQPITVTPREAFLEAYPHLSADVPKVRYVVMFGHRRLAAAHIAGLPFLLIHVADRPENASTVLSGALIENIHRKGLEPLEEAAGVADLLNEYGGSQSKVAKALGMSPGWVSQRLTLLRLIPELQQQLRDNKLTVRDARKLGVLDPDDQLGEWERLKVTPEPTVHAPTSTITPMASSLSSEPPGNPSRGKSVPNSSEATSRERFASTSPRRSTPEPAPPAPDGDVRTAETPVQVRSQDMASRSAGSDDHRLMLALEFEGPDDHGIARDIYEALADLVGPETTFAVIEQLVEFAEKALRE